MNKTGDLDYAIMVTLNTTYFTTPLLQRGLGIDIMDFAPIALMAEDTFLLWVHKGEGITPFEQFLEEAKNRDDGWVMGGTGRQGEDEFITNVLNANFGLTMKYIPDKGGGAVAKDLAGRQVTSTVNNPSEAIGFYQSGDLISLVAFTDERLAMFPDVPTLKEKGVDFSYFTQRAVVGAPGMSDEAVAFYQDVFTKVFESPRWQDYMAKQSLLANFIMSEPMREYWVEQRDRHEKILKASGAINGRRDDCSLSMKWTPGARARLRRFPSDGIRHCETRAPLDRSDGPPARRAPGRRSSSR
ncbi:Bug family tripartite tricarboxylate transporter substrate binding protein [Thermohalobaculum xanthum]|uniref:Bug family tripartite tricarboxylate transporter substrate binding protein n=1 Tax=Thermohalobaculum xanthum TaxID=2753746 RepID=UPI001F265FA0|nr:tripartite tricarboxylate transporter substrate binding protein [Thermohalobaculum xanthum]